MFKLAIMLLASFGDTIFAKSPCDIPQYQELVNRTEARVVERGEFRAPIGFFRPDRRYGCALITFEIELDGTVNNIKTIISYPTRIMAASAKSAIVKYKFDAPPGDNDSRGALVFEVVVEND